MNRATVRYLGHLPFVLITLWAFPLGSPGSDSLLVPDDPLRGRLVFEQKGCVKCHAVLGAGAFIGPDLGDNRFYGDILELGRVMWNHSPDMSERMQEMLQPRPTFSTMEINDLFVFLFYLRYLGEPGNPQAGKKILAEKGCHHCHQETVDQGGLPSLRAVAEHASPVALAQAMWNHGPGMERQMRALDMPRPRFEGEEIAHLAAYLKSLCGDCPGREYLMKPGNPRAGERIFEEKGCIECHSIEGKGGDKAPDLAQALLQRSVTEVAGIMWNHGPRMWEELGSEAKRATFEGDEMADVIAYLYFAFRQIVTGDKENGAHVFKTNGCGICHDKSAGENFVLDLSQTHAVASPVEMVRMMWNHAPQMEELMRARNIPWPKLHEGEMADLYLYIAQFGAASKR